MSFGGRDNKRKFSWNGNNRGAKRFHGSMNKPREDFQRDGSSRWDRGPPHMQESFPNFNYPPNNSWGYRDRHTHNTRFNNSNMNNNINHQFFDFPTSGSTGQSKEREELVGPGSDTERMEKVLATKRRIEEALASKSSNDKNKEIHFQNSSNISSQDKSKDKDLLVSNSDLSLTNSDFKEIGSVASAVPAEGEIEANPTTNIAPSSSQQRSFDNTTSNTPASVQVPPQKSQKVGGWSISAGNEIISGEPSTSSTTRVGGEKYIQEHRETILGNVPTTEENTTSASPRQSNGHNVNSRHENDRDEFSRVGRLYQSFLKSRLFGYTIKLRDKTLKPTCSNPLLDKSVLGNRGSDENVHKDQVLELHMPLPIKIKRENSDESNMQNTPEQIAAEEANEFCKEFSFLLKDPNFLIPPEDLEKLGLGHLSEMNKLICSKRGGGLSEGSFGNQDGFLQMRNLDSLNAVQQSFSNNVETSQFGCPENSVTSIPDTMGNSNRFNERSFLLHPGSPLTLGHQSPMAQSMKPDTVRRENTALPQSTLLSAVSVEAVVEKVVKTILQPSSINSVLNSHIQPGTFSPNPAEVLGNVKTHNDLTGHANNSHLPGLSGSSMNGGKNTSHSLNEMQDVSSKVLRLFLIDKQIEELMSEKNKIYNEILSSKEVSSTLFNSWAQDQIQQGNVMNVVTNTSNVIPELSRIVNCNAQESNPCETKLCHDNALEETISELYSLKEEISNPNMNVPEAMESLSCDTSGIGTIPPDSCFSTPKDTVIEENRPKLSVRKDLLDPNLSTPNLLTVPVSPEKEKEKEKKKKKTKKKEPLIINLIEDTDDEVCTETANKSATTDESSTRVHKSEEEVHKKEIIHKQSNFKYELDRRIGTCMTIVTLKKSTVLIVGCKDGFVLGYALGESPNSCMYKVHKDTITAAYNLEKTLITGSLDSTICIFSLKDQVASQTLNVNAPVQCMDIKYSHENKSGELVVGTRVGSICSYNIRGMGANKKKSFVTLQSNTSLNLTKSSILAVKLAKEGVRKVLIVASRGEQITVRDATSGLLLRTFDWCDTVYCLELYKETPFVFCGTNTKSIKVVNYTDGENSTDCMVGRSINQIVFLHTVMFASSYDGNIYIIDTEKRRLITTISIFKGIIQCMAIDSRSSSIFVTSSRGELQQIPFPTLVIKRVKRHMNETKKNKK